MNSKYRYNYNACFELLVGVDEEDNPVCYWVYDPSLDNTPEEEKYPSMRGLDPNLLYAMPGDPRILAVSGFHLDTLPHDSRDVTHSLSAKYGLSKPAEKIECRIIDMQIEDDGYGIKYPVRFSVILDGRSIKGFLLQVNGKTGQNFVSPPSKRGTDGKYHQLYDFPDSVLKQIETAAITEFKASIS